jgi:transposase
MSIAMVAVIIHCGHGQSLLPPFNRRDVKYSFRLEEHVLVSLIGSTAQDVAQRLGIAAETVERIVKNCIDDTKAKQIDPKRQIVRLGIDEISLRKGHKGYATILSDLTDAERPHILALAKGRDAAAGQACLERLSLQQRQAVRFDHTDMGSAYLKACADLLPNSQSVIEERGSIFFRSASATSPSFLAT